MGGRRAYSDQGQLDARSRLFATLAVLGFGLFYGVSTSSYLSAFASVDESFLFVPDIFFNVAVAVSVVATAGTIVVLTVRGRLGAFSLPYWVPVGLLIAVNIAVMVHAFDALPWGLPLLIPAIVYGVCSVMLRLVWLEMFAVQKPASVIYQMALGFALGAVLSVILQNANATVQALLSCALLVVIGMCARSARRMAIAHADGIAFGRVQSRSIPYDRYKDAFLAIGDAIIAFWVLEAVVGLLNSFMLAEQISFAGSGSVATLSRFGALVVFSLFAFSVRKFPKISTFSRIVMPILAALLVFLPFLSEGYSLFFNVMLLGCYYFVAMLITFLAVEVAHTRGISVYVLMGIAMMGTRLCLAIALIGGYAMGSLRLGMFGDGEGTLYFLMVIVVVIYVLSMAAVFLSRGKRRRDEERRWFGVGDSEVLEETGEAGAPAEGDIRTDAADGSAEDKPLESDDTLDARCAALAEEYGLTERETEIVALLARGRTKAHIAKTLYVSENTVRSHVRNIYAKLDVHTRQELIDLIEVV